MVFAAALHIMLIALILSWRAPPPGPVARAIEIALIAQNGQIAVSPPLVKPPIPELAPNKPLPATVTPVPQSKAVALKGGDVASKTKPTPPDALASLVVDTALGGTSLSAKPMILNSDPAPFSPPVLLTAGGKSCDILEAVQTSLRTHDQAQLALSSIPRQSRSVSNAILLWDRRWVDVAGVRPETLLPLENLVVQGVSQASPACRSQLLHGPRLIILGDAQSSTVLAFGSGDWRWADMIDTLSPSELK